MSIARSPGIAIRATSSFATTIPTRLPSISNTRWSRPLLAHNRASFHSSTPYLCSSPSTRRPTALQSLLLSKPSLISSSSAMTSTLRSVQKCAFTISATSSSSTPSSTLAQSSNPSDNGSIRNPTSSSSSSSSSSENPSTVYTNPYRAKRTWPPVMSKLSSKQQFRLERKYRRRAKLKWARPTWTKWTKLVQWAMIGFVLVYCVMFLDLGERENPFQPIRDYVHESMKGLLSTSSPPSFQKEPTTPTPKSAKGDS
ncbi:hypothetical protein AJ78_03426 [Emergomyces pasteurianus Ep9510]|uniref:Uncharacterized protein n=1 Tax=Emergomyces pasteurianus Ep9510 TaxID=1447872 RepID=A0A1J9QKI2_9EURO|nr:hypothetical protein AJ78_03426 [Emergomyces pasteurianus Ep9510]